MEISLLLSKKIWAKLREECEKTGSSEEELVLKALLELLGEPIDPKSRVEFHIALSDKYMKEAEELLRGKNYVQASEKFWGSALQMVKALAAERGLELRSHGELHREVIRIVKETGDEEIRILWQSAITLHQNFYEGWLPPEMVEGNAKDVKKLVEKLRKLLKTESK